MSNNFGFLIESMVSVLLLMTILYCVRLNKQLRLLKADEGSLRATITELISATEIAQRAIAGLKTTMRESEQSLGEALQSADKLSETLGQQVVAGESLLVRITRIVGVSQPGAPAAPPAPDAKALAAAAQAFAERTRTRASGLAA